MTRRSLGYTSGLTTGLIWVLAALLCPLATDAVAQEDLGSVPALDEGYYGLWRFVDAADPSRAILYRQASARWTEQVYRDAGFTAIAISDTATFSYFLPDRWFLQSRRDSPLEDEIDLTTGLVSRSRMLGGRPFGVPEVYTTESYTSFRMRESYREQMTSMGRRLIAIERTGGSAGAGLINISLPAMPSAFQGIFGSGKSSLSVSGSERISISGTSRWFPYRQTNALSNQSRFPDLDMKQDLFLKLSGTIGDKVRVDIDQNSNAESSLENQIKIRYEGYDDDVIRRVNLGNTSLSLPGTRYVSYGGRHEGLFGVSAEAQIGPIKFSGVASKQESEATTRTVPSRTAQSEPVEIQSANYIRHRYFFLDDPNRLVRADWFNPLTNEEIASNELGLAPRRIDAAEIRLLKDDLNGRNNLEQNAEEVLVTPSGKPPCDCDDPDNPPPQPPDCDETSEVYNVVELVQGVDYIVHASRERFEFQGTVIELLSPLLDNEMLAAAYLYRDELGEEQEVGAFRADANPPCDLATFKMIGPPIEILRESDLTEGPWGSVHSLAIRNVYRLGGTNIDELDLEVVWDRESSNTQSTNLGNVPYLEIVGLDLETQQGSSFVTGSDRRVDNRYLDRNAGILHFPQLRPFAPDSFDILYRRSPLGIRGFVFDEPVGSAVWPEFQLTGADSTEGDYPEDEIYVNKATVYRLPSDIHRPRFRLTGELKSAINTIQLNAFNIIDGSESVTAGSRELVRGTHYDIDYEFGIVTIRETANVSPDEEVNVTFAYAPLFGTSSRTIIGFSSSVRPEGGNYGFSSTWLFDSKGNPERRVKLGEEPTRSVIGEFAGDWKTESTLLTNVLGLLPFYTPATRSQINMAGAVGLSLPNPNTKGRAYIDDFDASRDARELSMTTRSWHYPSIPTIVQEATTSNDQAAARRGNQVWYSPRRASLRGHLNPTLDSDEANDGLRLVEWWMLPNEEGVDETIAPEDNWYGLTQPVSRSGEDLSTAQFLEVWINDFRDGLDDETVQGVRESGVLYIDIGEVSEDAVWWRTGPDGYEPGEDQGIGFLDSEDANNDGRLDESLDINEDVGLDQEKDGEREPDVKPTLANDRHLDDWWVARSSDRPDDENDPRANLDLYYSSANGTEANSSLDTEDLDGDVRLSRSNNYITYRIDLSNEDLVVTDVLRDFTGADNVDLQYLNETNGWRLLRIPLGLDFEFERVGIPDLTLVKHVRLWMTGLEQETKVQVGKVEFIGNRWLTGDAFSPILNESGEPAEEGDLALGQKFAVSVINNKENGDVYEPAFELERDRDAQAGEEFEGYLSLDVLNFPTGHSGTCYRPFAQDQDYTLYETIEMFVQLGEPEVGPEELEFFIRFGSGDGSNFYEYRRPVQTGAWDLVKLPLKELSNLKQNLTSEEQFIKVFREEDGSWLSMKGRPSLTRVRRITLGVTNSTGRFLPGASVWVNELRLTDVQRNPSVAGDFKVSTRLSDLGTFNFDWQGRQADFTRVGESRGTGINSQAWATSGNVNVDRFAPRLQMRIPASYSYRTSTSEPKFQTGSDLVFEGANQELNLTRTSAERFEISYSRTPSRNPLMRYTVDALTAGYTVRRDRNQRPTTTDSTLASTTRLGWSFATPRHGLIKLPLGITMDYLPSQLNVSGSAVKNKKVTWSRPSSDLTEALEFQNETNTETRSLSWSTGYRIFHSPNVNYQFNSTRDLMQDGVLVSGMNLGLETSRRENLSASYSLTPVSPSTASRYPLLGPAVATILNTFAAPLRPSVTWTGSFSGNVNLSRVGQGAVAQISPHRVDNRNNTTARAVVPVNQILRSLKSAMTQVAPGGGKNDESEEDDEEAGDEGEEGEEEGGPGGPKTGGGQRGRSPQATPESATPEAKKSPLPLGFRLAVTDVSGQYTRTRSSRFSYIDDMPSWEYQLGITRDPGDNVSVLPTNSTSLTDTDLYDVSSGVKLRDIRIVGKRLGAVFDVSVKYSRDRTVAQTVTVGADQSISAPQTTVTQNTNWPELQLTTTGLQQGLGFLERRFAQINIQSRFTRRRSLSGDQSLPIRSLTTNTDWAPLISVDTRMKSGMRINFRANRRRSESLRNQFSGESVAINESSDLNLTLAHTLEWKRRIPIPGGAQRLISTRIDLSLGFSMQGRRSITVNGAAGIGVPTITSETRGYEVSGEARYNFTRNITGTARLNYGEDADLKTRSATSRRMGLTVTASFQF